jgi:hypothetical protein
VSPEIVGKDTVIATDTPSASLLARTGELKRQLVDFAESPRFDRWLTSALQEAAGPERLLEESTLIRTIDDFIFTHRSADGKTVIDRFVATRPDLPPAERDMLLGWRDSVMGIFEVRHKHEGSLTLLNLLDDLEYRTYSNMGLAAFRSVPVRGFLLTRLVPIAGVWLVSGLLSAYPESSSGMIAEIAIDLAVNQPALVFRNPEKIEQGWRMMRRDRADFIDYFGGDEVVLPPAEAEERMDAHLRRRPGFKLPEGLFGFDTVGIIFDDVDGLNFYPDYGLLQDLFTDPALAVSKEHTDVLRAYLREKSIQPLPLLRLAAAYPDTVDAVYKKILRQRNFTWAEHGEALLRKRKAWYYERQPRPGVSVIGQRLNELAAGR